MLTMLGIPNCNTIKKAKQFLEEGSVPYTFRDVRKEPLSLEEWRSLVDADKEGKLLNTRSPTFRKAGVPKDQLNPEKTAEILHAYPSAMKRPTMVESSIIRSIGFSEDQFAAYLPS